MTPPSTLDTYLSFGDNAMQSEHTPSSRIDRNQRRKKKKATSHKNTHAYNSDQGEKTYHSSSGSRAEDRELVHPKNGIKPTPQTVSKSAAPIIKPSSMPSFNTLNRQDNLTTYYRQAKNKPSPRSRRFDNPHDEPEKNIPQHPKTIAIHSSTQMKWRKSKKTHSDSAKYTNSAQYTRLPDKYLAVQKEYSAGGIIIKGLTDKPSGSTKNLQVAVIGRIDRRGKLLWSIPKGHIEHGETAEIAAKREICEETGLTGDIIGKLGVIHYNFNSADRRVHKTVHHFLLTLQSGTLSADDQEIAAVKWVAFDKLLSELTYADEKKLHHKAHSLLKNMDTSIENITELINTHYRVEPNSYEKDAAEKNAIRNNPISRPPHDTSQERLTYKERSFPPSTKTPLSAHKHKTSPENLIPPGKQTKMSR